VVSESRGQGYRAAIHHTGVYKGGDGVELLPVALTPNSGAAAGSRAEEGHATLEAITRIRQRDLGEKGSCATAGEKNAIILTIIYHFLKKFFILVPLMSFWPNIENN